MTRPYYGLGSYNRIICYEKVPNASRMVAVSKTRAEGHKIVDELNKLQDRIHKLEGKE